MGAYPTTMRPTYCDVNRTTITSPNTSTPQLRDTSSPEAMEEDEVWYSIPQHDSPSTLNRFQRLTGNWDRDDHEYFDPLDDSASSNYSTQPSYRKLPARRRAIRPCDLDYNQLTGTTCDSGFNKQSESLRHQLYASYSEPMDSDYFPQDISRDQDWSKINLFDPYENQKNLNSSQTTRSLKKPTAQQKIFRPVISRRKNRKLIIMPRRLSTVAKLPELPVSIRPKENEGINSFQPLFRPDVNSVICIAADKADRRNASRVTLLTNRRRECTQIKQPDLIHTRGYETRSLTRPIHRHRPTTQHWSMRPGTPRSVKMSPQSSFEPHTNTNEVDQPMTRNPFLNFSRAYHTPGKNVVDAIKEAADDWEALPHAQRQEIENEANHVPRVYISKNRNLNNLIRALNAMESFDGAGLTKFLGSLNRWMNSSFEPN